jgi:short-subunit dehydrogenase
LAGKKNPLPTNEYFIFVPSTCCSMENIFHDKVIVITGGTSGIGRALAKGFIGLGAKVAVCARKEHLLIALKRELATEHLFVFTADVSIEDNCRYFIESVMQHFGHIDVLINNAGMSMRALFKDLESLLPLKKLMDVNFWGAVYCTHYALPHLIQSKGTVVGVSSIAGYRGLPGRTGYSASKFAMQGFLEGLRTEQLHTGMHVMWVCPGFTASNIRNTALNASGNRQGETPLDEGKLMTAEEVADHIIRAISKKRRTIILTRLGKLTVWMNRLFPALSDKLVYNHFKKEPGSPLQS